jgi:copper homeostasis protein
LKTQNFTRLEIACYNWISCENASQNGADRIELFENLPEGGVTPSLGMIKQSLTLNTPIYVMIRPRGGDFQYSDAEFQIMKSDVQACKSLGVKGIVFGILNSENKVDNERCRELLQLWNGPATFHRAFDETSNAFQAAQTIIDLGFERILTSGQKPNVMQGLELISDLITQFGNQITIMPGCGVTSENATAIIQKTGATEIHATCKRKSDQGFWYSDPSEIRELKSNLQNSNY